MSVSDVRVGALHWASRRVWCSAVSTVALLLASGAGAAAQDRFVDQIVQFAPGRNAGFGSDRVPGIVLGPPHGAGTNEGSLDVLSLGDGGSIVLRFADPVVCDAPGPDFTIFENPFHAGSPTGPVFVDVGIVAVSQDGVDFVEFPYDAVSFAGLAGREPVLSNPENGLDPTDPAVSGGDTFDLADVGLPWAAYVRITDPGTVIPDPGNRVPGGDNAGFDLDAIAAIHACGVSDATPTPSATPTPTSTATPSEPTVPATATHTLTVTPSTSPTSPTATPSPSQPTVSATTAAASPTATVSPYDLDGDGAVTEADLQMLMHAIFDPPATGNRADVNADGAISSADITMLEHHLRMP